MGRVEWVLRYAAYTSWVIGALYLFLGLRPAGGGYNNVMPPKDGTVVAYSLSLTVVLGGYYMI